MLHLLTFYEIFLIVNIALDSFNKGVLVQIHVYFHVNNILKAVYKFMLYKMGNI